MQYALQIFGNVPTGVPVTTLTDFRVEGWSKRMNAPGKLSFSLDAFNAKATDTNLRKKRRVKFWRKNLGAWVGYIEDSRQIDNRIEVICEGALQIFSHRYTALNEAFTGQGSAEAFGLLSDANGDSDTGITQGTGGVTTTKSLTMEGSVDMLSAFEKIGLAHDAEYEIDDDWALNYVPSLGSDKSGTIHLTFYRDGSAGTNLNAIEIGESGRDMANRIIGTTTGGAGYTSTQNDATSQSTYGLWVERKQFNEAQTQATLDSMTQAYLAQRANPITDYRVDPKLASQVFNVSSGVRNTRGLEYEDLSVGDLITVTVVTETGSGTVVKRVAEIGVEVDEYLQERMLLTLSNTGVYVTAAYLDSVRVDTLTKEVKRLEQLV